MTGYAVLLHGVNVGGNRRVPMADFARLLTELGHDQVATHLNSGNAVFASERTDVAALTREVEQALHAALGFDVVAQIRSADQLARIVDENPLPEAETDPSHFLVVFLGEDLPADWITGFDADKFPNETVRHSGSTLYLLYRKDIGRSKLTLDSLGVAKTVGTGRNWKTVGKLLAMAREREG